MRQLYLRVFKNEAGKEVLADLRDFCYATKTPFAENPYETALNVGKQEVFMQIMATLQVEFDQIYVEYDPRNYD